jgi:hypothetical protein
MSQLFDDTLDIALERQLAGETVEEIVADFPDKREALTQLLPVTAVLSSLPPVSLPDPATRQADRTAFLANMAQLRLAAVSPGPLARLKGYGAATLSWIGRPKPGRQKEKTKMISLILKATLALTILFGAAGGTAVTAANSLPDSPIYPVKLALEDAQLSLVNKPETAVALHTDLAAERIREMERLALADHTPDKAVLSRLQYHLEAALDLAAQLPEQEMVGALLQIQTMVQTRTRALEQAQNQAPEAPQAALTQARTMLQNAGDVVADGLQDPETLRQRHTINRPDHAPIQPEMTPRSGGLGSPTVPLSVTRPITTPVRLGPCVGEACGTPQGEGPYGPGRIGPQPEDPGDHPGPGPGQPPANPGSGNSQGPAGPNNPTPGNGQPVGPQPGNNGDSGENGRP